MTNIGHKLLLGELAFAAASASAHIPVTRSKIDAATLAGRNGELMQILRLRGVPSDTADDAHIDAWKHQRHSAFRSIAHPLIGVWFHAVRRELNAFPDGEAPPGYARDLDTRWRARWASNRFFTNEFYITVVRRTPAITSSSPAALIDRVLLGGKAEAAARERETTKAYAHLVQATQQLQKMLAVYGAHLLEADSDGNHAALSMLGYLVNGEYNTIALPQSDLTRSLAWNEIEFGRSEVRIRDRVGRSKYSAIVSVDEYPPATLPGMLDTLLHLPAELVFTQSFTYEAQGDSRKELKRQGARYEQVDDDAKSLSDELVLARDQLARNALVFGFHQLTIQVIDRDRSVLSDLTRDVIAKLSGFGIVTFRETRGLEPAFWSRLPGNRRYTARAVPISSANLACLASFHSVPEGRIEGNHWGPAISALETMAGTPYFFNFHKGDVGHTVIIGGTGSGKTTAQCFLLAQARRCKPRLWLFDKDRGAEIFVRACGGEYSVIRAGAPTGWNPFQLPDSKETRRFLVDLLVSMCFKPNESVPPRDVEELDWAVARTMTLDLVDRRLGELAPFIQKRDGDDALWRRLGPWHGKGSLAWVFDNPTDKLSLGGVVLGFDMTTLLKDEMVCAPALAYVFERVSRDLRTGDDVGTIISVEELQHFLRHPTFAQRLVDWSETIRKANGMLICSTQQAKTFLATDAGQTLLQQAATQVLFPNPNANRDELTNGWNLSEREADLVMHTAPESRAFLVRQSGRSVLIRLDLSEMPDDIAVLSGREHTVRLCEEIRSQVGDDPARWLPLFLAHVRKEKVQ